MNNPHPTKKSQRQIAHEWDEIAQVRFRQINSGLDLTYHHVLVPTILRLSGSFRSTAVIDVGCGTGHLAGLISTTAAAVTAIDLSRRSIQLASQVTSTRPNVHAYCVSIEEFAANKTSRFDIAIANMTLMDCLRLQPVVDAIAEVLRPGGALVATITHPWFWPKYWHYDKEPWFCYADEIVIEASFAISGEATNIPTTHVHRPLEMYTTGLSRAGFRITDMVEPRPPPHIHEQYSRPWEVPRYLAFRAVRG